MTEKLPDLQKVKTRSYCERPWVFFFNKYRLAYILLLMSGRLKLDNFAGVYVLFLLQVDSVSCTSLERQFCKLEVMGSRAFQLLQKILHPVSMWVIFFFVYFIRFLLCQEIINISNYHAACRNQQVHPSWRMKIIYLVSSWSKVCITIVFY